MDNLNLLKTLRSDIENTLPLYEKKIFINFINSEIKNAYLRFINNLILNSRDFLKLYQDYKLNAIGEKYYFQEYEIYIFSKIFCKIKKIKTKCSILKTRNIPFLFFKTLKIFFIFLFSVLKIQKVNRHKNLFYFEDINYKDQTSFAKKIKTKCINIDKSLLISVGNISFNDFKKIFNIKYIRLYELNLRFYIYKDALTKLSPKIIFLFEGDSPDHEIISKIAKQKKIITCCFQWGSITNKDMKYSFKNMSFDFFCCWGDFYLKSFKKYNKSMYFFITGNPLIKNIKLKDKIVFLMHPKTIFINKNEENNFLNLIKKVKEKFKNNVIIRLHPQRLQNIKLNNITIHRSKKIPLIDSLKDSFCTISIRSSAIIESARMGVIPIIFSKNIKHLYLNRSFHLFKKIKSQKLFFQNSSQLLEEITKIKGKKKIKLNLSKNVKIKSLNLIKFIGKKSENEINKAIRVMLQKTKKINN